MVVAVVNSVLYNNYRGKHMKNIGNRLREIRESKKLSRREVAERLQHYGIDISDKTLYGYEVGRTSANADMFLALCDIYGIDNIAETFKDASYQANTEIVLTVDEIEIINQYRLLDGYGKKAVKNILDLECERLPDSIKRIKAYAEHLAPYIKRANYEGKYNEEENK